MQASLPEGDFLPKDVKLKIRDLKVGMEITTYFCLDASRKKTSKDGSDYLVLELSDVSGTIRGFMWNDITVAQCIRPFAVVEVMAIVKSWGGYLTLNIKRMRQAWGNEIDVQEVYDLSRSRD